MKETGAGSACGQCRFAIARVHAGETLTVAPCRRQELSRDAA
jgi:hypothetical protein